MSMTQETGRVMASGAVSMALVAAVAQAVPPVQFARVGEAQALEELGLASSGEALPATSGGTADPEADPVTVLRMKALRGDGAFAVATSGGAYREQLVVELSEPVEVDWERSRLLLVEQGNEGGEPIEVAPEHEDGTDDSAGDEQPSDEKAEGEAVDATAGDVVPGEEPAGETGSKDKLGDSTDDDKEQDGEEPGTPVDDASDEPEPRKLYDQLVFAVPEGRYARLWVEVLDVEGTPIESEVLEHVTFDEKVPVAHALVGSLEPQPHAILPQSGALTLQVVEDNIALDAKDGPCIDAVVTDEHSGKALAMSPWSFDERTHTWTASVDAEPLADGSYAVEISCEDATGNAMRTYRRSFSIDTQPPQISVAEPRWDVAQVQDRFAYFDADVALFLEVSDAYLDDSLTTVLGVPLEELVVAPGDYATEGGTFSCAVVEEPEIGDGMARWRIELLLHDGRFDVGDLVRARDVLGRWSSSRLEHAGQRVGAIVVDTHAPQVRPCVSTRPSQLVVAHDDGGHTAFFCEPTTLELSFFDDSGIARVSLDEGNEGGTQSLRVSGDRTRATLSLANGPVSDEMRVVVEDLAGNVTWWSLAERGEEKTFVGHTVRGNEALVDAGGAPVAGGHPHLLIEDVKAPVVTLTGVSEGSHTAERVELSIEVRDDYLGYLASCMPDQPLARVTCDGQEARSLYAGYDDATLEDRAHTYHLSLPARDTHRDDGAYVVEVQLADVAGNVSRRIVRSFVIDTTAPVLSVSFDDAKPTCKVDELSYFAQGRSARIELEERFFSLEDLNRGDALVAVMPRASLGRTTAEVAVSPWKRDDERGVFWCDVTFPVDGTYVLEVAGRDRAGNLLVGAQGTAVDAQGRYMSESFAIDATKPRVAIAYSSTDTQPGIYEGKTYYSRPVTVTIEVVDRNLDMATSTVTTSDGRASVPAWKASAPNAQGEITYTASLLYMEEGTGEGAGRKQVRVEAHDLAQNVLAQTGDAFVVDQTAPAISRVWVSKDPTATGADAADADPYWFYNERDGVAAVLGISFGDEFLLDSAWVVDPDGVYDLTRPLVRGASSSTIELRLRDFVEEGAERNTELERNVLLYVRDLAGNERVWSLDRTGRIVADRVTSDENVSIGDAGLFPVALIRDTTAPRVSLAGVETGAYYDKPQVVHVAVTEHNFGYLTRFDPRRALVTVNGVAGNEGQAHTSFELVAQALEGTSPYYGSDLTFETDGHYELVARFEDMAGNESNLATLGSFTVDTTAPVVQVSWDNDDARNGSYYRSSRTATITVTEHNFDPALFSIETSGVVGGWSSSGDAHTCQVAFASDAPASAPHTLVVRGRDLAGNEATAYEEPPFVVDTQAPHVEILRRVSAGDAFELALEAGELLEGSAFAQAIEPLVVFEDEANLDVASIEVRITGKRGEDGLAPSLYERRDYQGDNRVVVDWGNLGLAENEEGPFFRVEADDVYTIEARVADLAGNESQLRAVTFSVNRYGSNYFVEPLYAQASGGEGMNTLLVEPPRIVVHEINVSGAAPELEDADPFGAHAVTKEYANATSAIRRTGDADRAGYALVASNDVSLTNPYEGWTEYVYTIRSGNFGAGSSSDYGDGGQGLYRVDVSTHDKANHRNTTARFWESGASRSEEARDKSATVQFMLDEFGPEIEALDLPGSLEIGSSYEASFRLRDDITNGDYLSVLVDGKPVSVYADGSATPVGADGRVTKQGTYHFEIEPRTLLAPRSVEIRASDYTGLESRTKRVVRRDFRLTTLAGEAAAAVVLAGIVALVIAVVYRMHLVA